jgi:hypothetical protein
LLLNSLGDAEAVEIGQLDVELHDVRAETFGLEDRLRTVGGRPDDGVALGRDRANADSRKAWWSSTIKSVRHISRSVTGLARRGIGANPKSVRLVGSDFGSGRVMSSSPMTTPSCEMASSACWRPLRTSKWSAPPRTCHSCCGSSTRSSRRSSSPTFGCPRRTRPKASRRRWQFASGTHHRRCRVQHVRRTR